MKLYHSTSAVHLDSIKEHGLMPRRNRKGNWWTNVSSHPSMVYLSTEMNDFYGLKACLATEHDTYMILSVDTDFLYFSQFRPDENFIGYLEDGTNLGCSYEKRYKQIERAFNSPELAGRSIERGLIGYADTIPFPLITVEKMAPIEENSYYKAEFRPDFIHKLGKDLDTRMVQLDKLLDHHLYYTNLGYKNVWHKTPLPLELPEEFVQNAIELGRQNTHVWIETTEKVREHEEATQGTMA